MRRREQWILCCAAVVAVMCGAVKARAQQGPALIREGIGAYGDFDPQRALPLLRRGVDPKAGPRDSLWALGVQYLTQILYEQGDEAGARAWVRWAVRLVPDLKLDTLNMLSQVLAEFQRARTATMPRPDDARAATAWVWPSTDPGAGPGRIELRPEGTPSAVTATVVGQGTISPRLSLPAGSYEIEARAPGYRPVRVTREVLPGVTTVLAFSLEPDVLSADVRARVAERVASLLVTRFGMSEPACGAGALIGADGLLLTTYRAVRGADRIAPGRGSGVANAGVVVAAYDVSRDLVVLKLPSVAGDSLLVAPAPADSQYAWGFSFGNCRIGSEARVFVTWADRQRGVLRLKGSVPGGVPGSVVVAEDGALLGLVTGDTVAAAAAPASDLIAHARANVAAGAVRSLVEVARAERHRYGAMRLTAPAYAGATAQVTPQEPWHWPELAKSSALPFPFVGPEGRYRLVVTAAGQARYDSSFTIVPAALGELTVPAPRPVAVKKKGHFPWAVAVIGGLGAGAAAVLLGGKGGGGAGSTSQPGTGGITITIPNP